MVYGVLAIGVVALLVSFFALLKMAHLSFLNGAFNTVPKTTKTRF